MKNNIHTEPFALVNELVSDHSESDTKRLYRDLLYRMILVRDFETEVQKLFNQDLIHGTIHLGIGQEATAVGTTFALQEDDSIFVTHRGHGEVIGKGVEPKYMFAELLGKANGCCRGRGGSMHIADISKGVLAANGIVGANAPVACGAALTYQKKNLNRISVNYVGDGGNNEGAYLEALNLAALWRLPVVFVTVNNRYAMSTPLAAGFADTDLSKRAIPFGMNCIEVDGNNVLAVYDAMRKARRMALREGPVMLISHTYRVCGHSKSDVNRYRTQKEIDDWIERCPLARFKKFCRDEGVLTRHEIVDLKVRAAREISMALKFALRSPDPDPTDSLKYVYAE